MVETFYDDTFGTKNSQDVLNTVQCVQKDGQMLRFSI